MTDIPFQYLNGCSRNNNGTHSCTGTGAPNQCQFDSCGNIVNCKCDVTSPVTAFAYWTGCVPTSSHSYTCTGVSNHTDVNSFYCTNIISSCEDGLILAQSCRLCKQSIYGSVCSIDGHNYKCGSFQTGSLPNPSSPGVQCNDYNTCIFDQDTLPVLKISSVAVTSRPTAHCTTFQSVINCTTNVWSQYFASYVSIDGLHYAYDDTRYTYQCGGDTKLCNDSLANPVYFRPKAECTRCDTTITTLTQQQLLYSCTALQQNNANIVGWSSVGGTQDTRVFNCTTTADANPYVCDYVDSCGKYHGCRLAKDVNICVPRPDLTDLSECGGVTVLGGTHTCTTPSTAASATHTCSSVTACTIGGVTTYLSPSCQTCVQTIHGLCPWADPEKQYNCAANTIHLGNLPNSMIGFQADLNICKNPSWLSASFFTLDYFENSRETESCQAVQSTSADIQSGCTQYPSSTWTWTCTGTGASSAYECRGPKVTCTTSGKSFYSDCDYCHDSSYSIGIQCSALSITSDFYQCASSFTTGNTVSECKSDGGCITPYQCEACTISDPPNTLPLICTSRSDGLSDCSQYTYPLISSTDPPGFYKCSMKYTCPNAGIAFSDCSLCTVQGGANPTWKLGCTGSDGAGCEGLAGSTPSAEDRVYLCVIDSCNFTRCKESIATVGSGTVVVSCGSKPADGSEVSACMGWLGPQQFTCMYFTLDNRTYLFNC
jgi:hypothetical protein